MVSLGLVIQEGLGHGRREMERVSGNPEGWGPERGGAGMKEAEDPPSWGSSPIQPGARFPHSKLGSEAIHASLTGPKLYPRLSAQAVFTPVEEEPHLPGQAHWQEQQCADLEAARPGHTPHQEATGE